jgi:plastocyanin
MFRRSAFQLSVLAGILSACVGCSNGYNAAANPNSPSPSPSSSSPAPSSPASVLIVPGAATLTTTAFNGNPTVVPKGTTVTWTNNDLVVHTSTSDNGAWNSGNIAPGGTFSTTLDTAGTFVYHCAIHPGMVGTVTVQ